MEVINPGRMMLLPCDGRPLPENLVDMFFEQEFGAFLLRKDYPSGKDLQISGLGIIIYPGTA